MPQQQKSLPPSPQPTQNIENAVPIVPPKGNNNVFHPPIVSGTKSLPSRNTSLKQLPIPSNLLTPNGNTAVSNRPPNVRSVSAYQTTNGRPVSYQQQQNRPPLPTHNSNFLQQQPPLPPHSPYLQQKTSLPSLNSPYFQQAQQQQSPVSPEPTQKKPSFMRSVMAAVSSPRSSFRQSKSNMKLTVNDNSSAPTIQVPSVNEGPVPRSSSFRAPSNKNIVQNMSTVSLDQQTKRPIDQTAQLRRYSAANLSEPQLSPQHLNIPPPQSPFGPRASTINNHSTPSFISSVNSSSQTSLALTPPLSRSSSPGSMTPVVLNRYTSASSSSSEDLGSPPESVSTVFIAVNFSFFIYLFVCFL